MSYNSVLISHHDNEFLSILEKLLSPYYGCVVANSNKKTLEVFTKINPKVVILDLSMPTGDTFHLIDSLYEKDENLAVICLTDEYCAEECLKCIKRDIDDYVISTADPAFIKSNIDRLVDFYSLLNEVNYLKTELKSIINNSAIQFRSPVMATLLKTIDKVAKSNSTVLLTGESGTGKELVAREIFLKSNRSNNNFVTVNCGAIPNELMESELFGHEKGAFTGATERKLGKFEIASGGTIFLDEISNMPHNLQAKLLRVLQEKEFERVGSTQTIKVDIRVISASNEDLLSKVKNGTFRQDLYYRLNVVPINIAPLRERREDVSMLALYFLDKYSKENSLLISSIDRDAIKALESYNWPGNVRELENLIERLVVMSGSEKSNISLNDLPIELLYSSDLNLGDFGSDYKRAMESFEKRFLINALHQNQWNKTKTAEDLQMHRNTLNLKIKSLKIAKP